MGRARVAALLGAAIIGGVAMANTNTPPIRYGYWNVPTELIEHLQETVSAKRLDHDFEAASFADLDTFVVFLPSWEVAGDIPFMARTGLDPAKIAATGPDELLHVETVKYKDDDGVTHFVFVNWPLFKERDSACQNAVLSKIIGKQDWDAARPRLLKTITCED